MKYTILLLAALLCGCEAKLSVGQSDSPPPAEPTSDGTLKTSYRVTTDGARYRYEQHMGAGVWLEGPARQTIDDACLDVERWLAWEWDRKTNGPLAQARARARSRSVEEGTWTNVPPILQCDK